MINPYSSVNVKHDAKARQLLTLQNRVQSITHRHNKLAK